MDDTESFERGLGKTIRTIRESRALTTRALAHLAGVSQSLLSNVENGRTVPSVRSLYAIAEALGVGPGQLMPSADWEERRERSQLPDLPGEAKDAPVIMRLLQASPDSTLETYRIEQRAGYRDRKQYQHVGEDIIHILEGRVTLLYQASRIQLRAGDTVRIDGVTPHSFSTPRTSNVVALIVTCRTDHNTHNHE